jgi:hypothetical protein
MRENRPSGLTSGMWKRKLSEFTAPHLDSTCRDDAKRAPTPAGTAEIECFGRPSGTYPSGASIPALKRRAIIASPSGTETGPVTSNPSGIGHPRPQRTTLANLLLAGTALLRGPPVDGETGKALCPQGRRWQGRRIRKAGTQEGSFSHGSYGRSR